MTYSTHDQIHDIHVILDNLSMSNNAMSVNILLYIYTYKLLYECSIYG